MHRHGPGYKGDDPKNFFHTHELKGESFSSSRSAAKNASIMHFFQLHQLDNL